MVQELEFMEVRNKILEMQPVFVPIGCIDHQQVFILLKSIKIGIIYSTPCFSGNEGVLGSHILPTFRIKGNGCRIVGKNMLKERQCILSSDPKTAHMADVKQARLPAGVQMLRNDAVRVHERHLPAAEFHHFSVQGQVLIVKRGFVRFAHGYDS